MPAASETAQGCDGHEAIDGDNQRMEGQAK
jgi:hypothetical protein